MLASATAQLERRVSSRNHTEHLFGLYTPEKLREKSGRCCLPPGWHVACMARNWGPILKVCIGGCSFLPKEYPAFGLHIGRSGMSALSWRTDPWGVLQMFHCYPKMRICGRLKGSWVWVAL